MIFMTIAVASYPLLWALFLFWEPAESVLSVFFATLSFSLLLLELRFNWRHLWRRRVETFRIRLFRINFLIVAAVAVVSVLVTTFMWPWASTLWTLLFAVLGCLLLGMCVGNSSFRRERILNATTFPWDLCLLYEGSLNPNIRKTYGPFLYIIPTVLLLALFHDARLFAVVIYLQLDNIFTRLRMTVPLALFLTTNYEKSVPEWLELKRAAGELSIPSLVLDRQEEIPRSIAVQQDLVRVDTDEDWTTAVRTVMKYCRYIVFDTHSSSEAIETELSIAREPAFVERVMFIRRPDIHPTIASACEEIESARGVSPVMEVSQVAATLARERNSAMGFAWQSPIRRHEVRASYRGENSR